MDYTPLYIGTFVMLLFSVILIWAILKVTGTRKYMEDRDKNYMNKFEHIERILREDINTILNILKNKTDDKEIF